MKSTRFYIKSLAITALMLAGVMQAADDMAESIAGGLRELAARQAAEQAAAVSGWGSYLYDKAAYVPRKVGSALASGTGWTQEKLGQFGGYMASKSPEFAQKWIAEHPVLAATIATAIPTSAILGAGAYGIRNYKRRPAIEEAQQYYKEIVEGKGLEEAVGGLVALEELYKAGKEKHGPYLSLNENLTLDKMFQARKMELEALAAAQQRVPGEEFKASVLDMIQELTAKLDAAYKQISVLAQKIESLRQVPSPVAPSSVSVQQPAAAVQPLTERELDNIYRRRTTSQAGIQGILNDEGLMARLKVSSGKTAQDILRKIGR
jgi:hypothetical protein